MVDIHSHILWGLDDGAASLEESVAMARLAAETGTTDIVATPHANSRYSFDPGLVRERVAELDSAVGGLPKLHTGCDFHLSFSNIERALEEPRLYTVNQLRYLMVELPETFIPKDLGTVFERMIQSGMLPVITHPERNRAIWKDQKMFESWLDAGCYVQITAQSLEGHFGRSAKSMAWKLLSEKKVHFVASDGHNVQFRPPRLDRAYAGVVEKCGSVIAAELFSENPGKLIDGISLPRGEYKRKQKSRFRLFG